MFIKSLADFIHYFNSIKVRLERNVMGIDDAILLFQFHKGTIRTVVLLTHLRFLLRFQFHKGTIRTYLLRLWCLHYSYFNSIKVRLEHISCIALEVVTVFQFHKGTIRTKILVSELLPFWDFNSIKVRLEHQK